MTMGLLSLLIVAGILAALAIGVPLAFSTGFIAIVLVLTNFGVNGISLVATRVFGELSVYAYVAVPMFVMMACVLERSGIARDLFRAMYVFGGRLRGGLAVQTLLLSVILASMSGIIGGEIVLLGLLALPEMLKRGYQPKLAIGTICAGGSLGTMIPPSVVLIIYGLTVQAPIGELFIAVVVPGLMLAGLYICYVVFTAIRYPERAPLAAREVVDIPLAEKLRLLRGTILPLFVAAWVLVCIYTGIASINEAAGMGVIGALISTAIRGELTWGLIMDAAMRTVRVTAMLMWVVFGATALIGTYNLIGGSSYVAGLINALPLGTYGVIVLMMLILFVLGMFMDWIGICLLTMPIFVPIVSGMGFDPVWFGVVFAMNMQMSYLTPPFGPAAIYLKGVAPRDMTLGQIYNAQWPFIGLQVIALATLVAFPELATWLPQVLRN